MTDPAVNSSAHAGAEGAAPDPRRWLALAIILTASFMNLIDITIVNIALPSIQRDLRASNAQIQLVIAAYELPYAVLLITGGRLGDVFGRKRLFMLGMAGFTVASVLCGAAADGTQLVVARFLQGVMVALMLPQVFSVIQVTFPREERTRAFGMFASVVGIASIAGPISGGLIIQGNLLGLQWRPVFLLNMPIGIVALIGAWRVLRESKALVPIRLDLVGVGIATGAMLLLVWPLIVGRQAGWPAWALVCLVVALLALTLFAWWERRLTALGRSPLVPAALFRDRAFVVGVLVALLLFLALAALILFFALYLQIGLGFSPLAAGVTTMPFAIATVIGSGLAAGLVPRLGRRILSAGTVVLCVGILLVLFTLERATVPLPHGWQLAPALFVAGCGLGMVIGPLLDIVLASTRSSDAGAASGLLNSVNVTATALGVAVIGLVFFGQLAANSDRATAKAIPALRAELTAAHVSPALTDQVVRGFTTCFRDRASGSDPTHEPESCRGIPGQVQAIAAANGRALAEDFTAAFERTILACLAVYAVMLALTFALPEMRVSRQAEGAPTA